MGSNDFGGKFVVFGGNICRNGKEGGKKQGTIWVYHNPKEFGMGLLEMWGCVERSTFSKDWKRANESKPGEKDSKAM